MGIYSIRSSYLFLVIILTYNSVVLLIETGSNGVMSRKCFGGKGRSHACRLGPHVDQAIEVRRSRLLQVVVPESIEHDEKQQFLVVTVVIYTGGSGCVTYCDDQGDREEKGKC